MGGPAQAAEVLEGPEFITWLDDLRDAATVAVIARRLVRLRNGNFGDVKSLGGVFELRIAYGLGFRLYFTHRRERTVVVLCGGDKGSQRRDIARARFLAAELPS